MVSVGEQAPDFKAQALVDGKEKTISLSDYKGKKVVVYFYPKDLTPGCTTQAENIRDNYDRIIDEGIVILGVSTDSIASHKKFVEKKELPFVLVADENKDIVGAYEVWGQKKFMGKEYMGTFRQTFLLDEDQKVVHVIEKPKVGNHTQEILDGYGL